MRKILSKAGFNPSIGFTITNRVIQALGSVLVIFLISHKLSKAEQGYYYTFGSMAALQVFFELGLSVVITQFMAHEFAFLYYKEGDNELLGDPKHIGRVASLLRFTFKWYGSAALVLLLIVTPAGFVFFSFFKEKQLAVSWQLPWLLLMFSTSVSLFISPYLPIFEGLGKVLDVAKFKFVQSGISYAVLTAAFLSGMKLYSLGIFTLSNALLAGLWLSAKPAWQLLSSTWKKFSKTVIVNWKEEVFPFQWRIALSWLSGYFIFQLLNPILFAFQGSEVAGQMGITITAFTGISVISMAWINTKIPTFSVLVAKKEFAALDTLFFSTLKQSAIVNFIMNTGLWCSILFAQRYFPVFGHRFLPPFPLGYVCINSIINQAVFAMAAYLRSHKEEPLLVSSVAGAVAIAIASFITAKWFTVTELTFSYMALSLLIFLPWNIRIFQVKRHQWHKI